MNLPKKASALDRSVRGFLHSQMKKIGIISLMILVMFIFVKARQESYRQRIISNLEKRGVRFWRDDSVVSNRIESYFLKISLPWIITDWIVPRVWRFDPIHSLNGSDLKDEDLKELELFQSLRSINLDRSKITDAGLTSLVKLKNLESLSLSRTQVTDNGLKTLSKLKTLRLLHLGVLPLTDEGISELGGLSNLQHLNLKKTNVSPIGEERVRKLIPSLIIVEISSESTILCRVKK